MHHERDISRGLARHEVSLKQMCVHSVSCFPYLMEAGLERYMLGLFPVTKCVMWNPMPSEGSID